MQSRHEDFLISSTNSNVQPRWGTVERGGFNFLFPFRVGMVWWWPVTLRKGEVEPRSLTYQEPRASTDHGPSHRLPAAYLGIRLRSAGPAAQTLRADGEAGSHHGAFHGDHVFPIKNWQVLMDLGENKRLSLTL